MNECSNEEIRCASACHGGCESSRVCSDGLRYVAKQMAQPPKKAIISCEGGCIKGEIARVTANLLAYRLKREEAVRICLGDAATGNSGFLELINRAPQVLAIEGCPLQCGTEILRKRIKEFTPVSIDVSQLYEFDRNKYFEIFDMPREEIKEHAEKAATYIVSNYF
jgi:uncharacterized metal-binding protein